MIDPRVAMAVARGLCIDGPELMKEGLRPSNQLAETQRVLTNEEAQLFDQLCEGGPCVVCGDRGAHAVKVNLCKFVNKTRSGVLFWKKDTYYYIRKTAEAPLCAMHYREAKDTETKGCVTFLVLLLLVALFSWLMLWLKQRGHCVIFDSDVGTFVLWFVVWFFVFAVLFGALGLLDEKRLSFDSVWKYGPLARLSALGWIKCDGDVGEKQFNEAQKKGRV